MRQVNDYIGKKVLIEQAGSSLKGILCFFNFKNQSVHLSEYTFFVDDKKVEEGTFIVVNGHDWRMLKIKKLEE